MPITSPFSLSPIRQEEFAQLDYVVMRHWTSGWLKRERYGLYKRLPREFGNGMKLPLRD